MNGTTWQTNDSSSTRILNAFITVEYPSANIVRSVDIIAAFSANNFPVSFDIQGSNDNVSYTIIESYTTGSGWTSDASRNFIVANTHIPYKYWRLFIVSNGSALDNCFFRNIRFNTGWSIGRITLASAYPLNTTQFKIVMADVTGVPVTTMSTSPVSWRYNILITKSGNVVMAGLFQLNANNTFSRIS